MSGATSSTAAISSSSSARSRSALSRRPRAAARARSTPDEPTAQRPEALRPGDGPRARERIQHGHLTGRAHQAPVLVLRREPHERPGEGGDGLARGGLAVDQRPGAPLGGHPARDHDLVLVLGELAQRPRRVVLVEPVPEAGGQREGRLHEGVTRPRSDRPRVGRRARQQAEGLGEHRLAGPGLTRDGGEARGRGQLGALDHDEVAHLERTDHDRPNFSR